jgi:hypothetical protein
MGVEHQVEERRPAMARSGDVDHPHRRPVACRARFGSSPPSRLIPLEMSACDKSVCDITMRHFGVRHLNGKTT